MPGERHLPRTVPAIPIALAKLALAPHDLEHRFGTGLAHDNQPVDLADFDRIAGRGDSRF